MGTLQKVVLSRIWYKKFSDWPTIPQLYVKGEFVGGCDIVREMYVSGELAELFVSRDVKMLAVSP